MNNLHKLIIGLGAFAIIAALTYIILPLIKDPGSFALGGIACLVLTAIGLLILFVSKTPRASRSTLVTKSSLLILWGLATGFVIYIMIGISAKHDKSQTGQERLEMARVEAERLSSQVHLVSGLIDDIHDELNNSQKRELSDVTLNRIAALSHTLKPRFLPESDTLSEIELSPERGQLLLALLSMQIDTASMYSVYLRTSFEGADLKGADLRGAYLVAAKLRGANLKDANIQGGNLSGADLRSADLWGAKLNNSICVKTDLRRADLRWTEINNASMPAANLSSARLSSSKLRNTDMTGAFIQWAFAQNAFFNDAVLQNSDLIGTNFEKAHMENTDLVDAILRRANLTDVNLAGADLTRADLKTVTLSNTNLHQVTLTDATISDPQWLNYAQKQNVLGLGTFESEYSIVKVSNTTSEYIIRRRDM